MDGLPGYDDWKLSTGEQEPSENQKEYEGLSATNRKQVCLEYLEARKCFEDFEAWRDKQAVKGEWLDDCMEWVEDQSDFWDWIDL